MLFPKRGCFCGTSKAPWSFFAINVRKYFYILGVQPRFHDGSIFCRKQSRYSLCSIPSAVPIISTLLFQIIIFERYSHSKIIMIQTFPSLVVDNNMLTVVVEKSIYIIRFAKHREPCVRKRKCARLGLAIN